MYNRYNKFVSILFFGSTLVSIIKLEEINPILWFLCAYLYLFSVDPMRSLRNKVFTTFNLLGLVVGYLLLCYQILGPIMNSEKDTNSIKSPSPISLNR